MENVLDEMPKQIAEEARDAMKYAGLALECRALDPDVADMYMELSGQELHHMQMISDKMKSMVEKLHAEYMTSPRKWRTSSCWKRT